MTNREKAVRVAKSGDRLVIEPAAIELLDGEWVRWHFEGLGEGEFGFISFAPPLPRLGPFHSLRSFTNTSILAKGNKGPAAGSSYDYLALVLNPDSQLPIASGAGKIHNAATRVDTAPEISVTYIPADPRDPGAAPTLVVSPDPVGLNTGDTATWNFVNLPPNAFACFQFEADPLAPGMKAALGPFLAFSACNGDDPVTVRASGTCFAAAFVNAGAPARFTYHIQLRGWNGERLAAHDPAIDNLGPPAPGG